MIYNIDTKGLNGRRTIVNTRYLVLIFCVFFFIGNSCNDDGIGMPHRSEQDAEGRQGTRSKFGPILFISYKKNVPYSEQRAQLYSMDEDGTHIQPIVPDTSFPITDAKWSPDGTMIAMTSPVGGVTRYGDALYVMNADGSEKRLITKTNKPGEYYATARNPVWSPDSKRIAFTRRIIPEVLGAYELFVINTDGTGEHKLISTPNGIYRLTDWSPDGSTMLGDQIGLNTRIAFISLNGNIIRTWERSGYVSYYGIYSPSSMFIAYVSNKYSKNGQSIYVMDNTGSLDTCLVNAKGHYFFNKPVSFSPDNSKLLYNAGMDSYNGNILVMDIKTGNVKNITPFHQDTIHSYAVSWKK